MPVGAAKRRQVTATRASREGCCPGRGPARPDGSLPVGSAGTSWTSARHQAGRPLRRKPGKLGPGHSPSRRNRRSRNTPRRGPNHQEETHAQGQVKRRCGIKCRWGLPDSARRAARAYRHRHHHGRRPIIEAQHALLAAVSQLANPAAISRATVITVLLQPWASKARPRTPSPATASARPRPRPAR